MTALVVGKAHQRIIREHRATTAADEDGLFGNYWAGLDMDIGRAQVREVDYSTAWTVIEKYEWLGSMPAIVMHCFGIYFEGVLGGAVVYSPEYAENLGVWTSYGWDGRLILLSRGACTHWAHPHAGSALVRRSMALLPDKYEVVTATVDTNAGEVGTIYQACGFDYVGGLRASAVVGWNLQGNVVRERSMRRLLEQLDERRGTLTEDVSRVFPMASPVVGEQIKHRYFAFRGTKPAKHRNRAAIAHLIKPYPKRAAGVGETSLASSEEVLGQFQPAAPITINEGDAS